MTTGLAVFPTAIGHCGLAWTEDGICATGLPEQDEAAMHRRIKRFRPDAELLQRTAEIDQAIGRIQALLAGEPDDLRDIAVDLAGVPEFNRLVYAALRDVGPGETTTYGELARAVGVPHASQQVGQAMGRNPVPIVVPCHRVLASGGRVGGFSAPGGVITKLRILQIEGAAPNGQPALF